MHLNGESTILSCPYERGQLHCDIAQSIYGEKSINYDRENEQPDCDERNRRCTRHHSRQRGKWHRDDGEPNQQPCARNDHRGTAISWRMRSITSPTDKPSISNSGRRIKRCSSTGTAIALMSSGVTKSRPPIAANARAPSSRLCVARGPAPTSTLSCWRVPRTISTM